MQKIDLLFSTSQKLADITHMERRVPFVGIISKASLQYIERIHQSDR